MYAALLSVDKITRVISNEYRHCPLSSKPKNRTLYNFIKTPCGLPHYKRDIKIDMCIANGLTPVEGCLDVMAPIHGVKVVVEAPVGEALPTP